MKKNKQYLYWGITAFLVVLAGLIAYYIIFHLDEFKSGIDRIIVILMPVIDGIILAYLFTPMLNFIEKRFISPIFTPLKMKKSAIRGISMILTIGIVFFLIYGFFAMVIPQLILSVQSIIIQFPTYVDTIEGWILLRLEDNPEIEKYATGLFDQYSAEIEGFVSEKVWPQVNTMIMTVSKSVLSILKDMWNLIIGFIISIYLLGSKEKFAAQAKKIVYSVKSTESANRLISNVRFSSKTFSGFFVGKIVDSIIIGILCFIVTSIIGTPFPVLISVIIGVTNIIPFFGPFLGAIPSLLLIVLISPIQALYFLIVIIVLQQVDGNIIGPKILGSSTGLPGFWVIFAITFFGGLMGVLGMILGVPIFAVFFAFVKSLVETKLEKKELPKETKKYLKLLFIDQDNNNRFIEMREDDPKPFEGITQIIVKGQKHLKFFEQFTKDNKEETKEKETEDISNSSDDK